MQVLLIRTKPEGTYISIDGGKSEIQIVGVKFRDREVFHIYFDHGAEVFLEKGYFQMTKKLDKPKETHEQERA